MTDAQHAVRKFADFPPQTFTGNIFRPGDEGFIEVCRIPNARVRNTPALVAQCRSADDILVAVNYCREIKERIAIRGGGHSIDGHAMPDGVFVIDTSLMDKVCIDPSTGVTIVEAGVLLKKMDATTQEHGYVVPSGTVSDTGIAGLTLGGGIGYLTRQLGMTVDSLRSVDVITIAGKKLTASEKENEKLFWGLRGAGHNLTIATSFTFQAHKIGPHVMSGLVVYPIDDAVNILSQMDKEMSDAPHELSIYPVVLPAPPLPRLPDHMLGHPIFVLIVVYTGDPSHYESVMAAIHRLANPLLNLVERRTWTETNAILDVLAPPGRRQHSRGGYLAAITRRVAQAAVDLVIKASKPTGKGPSVAVAFPCLGGKSLTRHENSTAYSRTGANWMWEVLGQWDNPEKDEVYVGWVDLVMNTLHPHSLQNGYVNLSTDRGPEWLRCIYGSPEKWEDLYRLKVKYDPDNLLYYNKNITRAQLHFAGQDHSRMRSDE